MIELYLDTADVAEVKRFNQCLPLKGVTTNPSILAKSKQGLNQTLAGMQEALGATPFPCSSGEHNCRRHGGRSAPNP